LTSRKRAGEVVAGGDRRDGGEPRNADRRAVLGAALDAELLVLVPAPAADGAASDGAGVVVARCERGHVAQARDGHREPRGRSARSVAELAILVVAPTDHRAGSEGTRVLAPGDH